MGTFKIETEGGHFYVVETEDPIPPNPSNAIPNVKPPTPIGLRGAPPSVGQQILQNIPGSLARTAMHPSFPGMPIGQGEATHPATFEDFQSKTLPAVSKFVQNLPGSLVDQIVNDPVGAAVTAAQLGRSVSRFGSATTPVSPEGIAEVMAGAGKGAVQGATSMIPLRHYGIPLDVPAPLGGAALGGFTGGATGIPHAREIGAIIGAGVPIAKGAIGGVRGALSEIENRGQIGAPGYEAQSVGPGPYEGLKGGIVKPFKPEPQPNPTFKPTSAPPGVELLEFEGRQAAQDKLLKEFGVKKSPLDVPPESQNASKPGATQADEFGKPPTQQTPPTEDAYNQLLQKYGRRPSVRQHIESIPKKEANILSYVSSEEGPKLEELKQLKTDLEQADDPERYHKALEKAKTLAKEVYVHSKSKGLPIPSSSYKTFGLEDIDTAIAHLSKPSQP